MITVKPHPSTMAISKESILSATNGGYAVFRHFLRSSFTKPGKAFKNPFYNDSRASCYIYRDRRSGVFKFKDFGDTGFSGDCFYFVGKIFNLACDDAKDFQRILDIIDHELCLNLADSATKTMRIIRDNNGAVIRASQSPSIHDGFETAEHVGPIQTRPFSARELSYWNQFGIQKEHLEQFSVIAISSYQGISKTGSKYELVNSDEEPIFGYQARRHTKLYRPFSKLRFLYAGEKTEHYVFGMEHLPLRGDIVFITGGEKDVLSLTAHGFSAICMNSETAHLPKNLLRGLGYRFRHIVLIYDVDETGLTAMKKHVAEFKEFRLKSLRIPLSGDKDSKDVSDFFRQGHSADDLMMVFREMLDQHYEDSIALMRNCEINFDDPPQPSEPLLAINEVPIGSSGNLVCVTGSEGSGKTNYLGGILSGAIRPLGMQIDTLGASIRENISGHAVLLFDTEQSEYQFYKNITYILQRGGLEAPPRWFKAFSLASISRKDRLTLILESIDRFYYEFGGMHMVVIDGIADLIQGVNDEESSVWLTEELFRLAAIYNTVIVCVLHLTPSGMKLRGHLGSEVQRKAAGILLVEKSEDQTHSLVKALKVRDGSPLDVPIIRFGWSKAAGKHVFMGVLEKEDEKKNRLDAIKEVIIAAFENKTYRSNKDLRDLLMDAFQVQQRAARQYLQLVRESGLLVPSSQFPNQYQLSTTHNGHVPGGL